MPKYVYLLVGLFFFGAGAYVWKVKNTGLLPATSPEDDLSDDERAASAPASNVVVEIAGEKLTQEDVDWEYQLLTQGLQEKEELTPIPDLGPRLDKELAPLRKALIADLIERKLLYKFIQQDKEFNLEDPGRFTQCVTELQTSLQDNASLEALAKDRDAKSRLRSRLCERSILDQYMKERLFSRIAIADAEVVEYYKNHVGEFKKPERVEIRQVLLADEDEAKKVRAQINSQNFADLARQKSIAPEAVDGGRLGPFSKTTLPAIFEVALHMRKGEISDILKSPYGYHVVMLIDKFPKEELSLAEARPEILAAIRKKKEEGEYQKWVEKALATINVSTPKPLW